MLIGYARVSTLDQTLALQQDALTAAGCGDIYTDTVSGSVTDRPGLANALSHLRTGDTLVVWRLDRLGRSLPHLIETVRQLQEQGIGFRSLQEQIDTTTSGGKLVFHVFGALAEFERDIIRERTFAGLAAARARGRMGGRPCNLDDKKKRHAMTLHADPSNSVKDIYRTLGIFNARLYRYLAEQRGRWSATPAVRRNDGPRSLGDVRLSSKLDGRALFSAPLLILSANSRRRSFGRNLGKLGHAEKAN